MMDALPDAIVSKILDHYKDGVRARMDARAARMRETFRELMSAVSAFEFREWAADGLNIRLMRLNDVCFEMPDDSAELREALDDLWDIVHNANRAIVAMRRLEDMA
jgi:hypothetical protein